MCHFTTSWSSEDMRISNIDLHLNELKDLLDDNLVQLKNNTIYIPEHARPFVRNICMAFDKKLLKLKFDQKTFSLTI
jgi:oxygen-independent coproporphyrinogen-3 oxidase